MECYEREREGIIGSCVMEDINNVLGEHWNKRSS